MMILQFISQRKRPIRGSVKRLLLEYIRNIPCKTSLTAAGCYLCAAPRSKGTKIIVCYSPESPVSSKVFLSTIYPEGHYSSFTTDEIIMDAKLHADKLVVDASDISFLNAKCSEAILREAVQLKLISESTYTSIHLLQKEECGMFYSQNGLERAYDSWPRTTVSNSSIVQLYPGHSCHFICRFVVTWTHHERADVVSSNSSEFSHNSKAKENPACQYCGTTPERSLMIRHMVDADWLYLAKLSKGETPTVDTNDLRTSNYTQLSAQAALNNLRHIPAAARRALPVCICAHNVPVCIPSIGFRYCPCLDILAEFRPRVPFGGGYSSYI